MGTFSCTGTDGLVAAFRRSSNVPDSVKKEILNSMAEIAADQQKKTGESLGVRDPDSDVHILDNIKINSPKITEDGGSITITFSGSRTRNGIQTRNAEIAFINEFGAPDRNIEARQFIKTANEKSADKANSSGEKVFGDWLENNFEKEN